MPLPGHIHWRLPLLSPTLLQILSSLHCSQPLGCQRATRRFPPPNPMPEPNLKIIRNLSRLTLPGTFHFRDSRSIARAGGLTPNSIRDALQMYFQPIRNDDPVVNFYTMYKRETMEYDQEYMKKYNEDLNTTLIFVSSCVLRMSIHDNYQAPRLVYSLQSALPSSLPSNQVSSRTLTIGPKPTSGLSFSASIHPSLQMSTLPPLRYGTVLPRRSSQHWTCCTRVC